MLSSKFIFSTLKKTRECFNEKLRINNKSGIINNIELFNVI